MKQKICARHQATILKKNLLLERHRIFRLLDCLNNFDFIAMLPSDRKIAQSIKRVWVSPCKVYFGPPSSSSASLDFTIFLYFSLLSPISCTVSFIFLFSRSFCQFYRFILSVVFFLRSSWFFVFLSFFLFSHLFISLTCVFFFIHSDYFLSFVLCSFFSHISNFSSCFSLGCAAIIWS